MSDKLGTVCARCGAPVNLVLEYAEDSAGKVYHWQCYLGKTIDGLAEQVADLRVENVHFRKALIEIELRLTGKWNDELQAKYHSRVDAALDCARAALNPEESQP